MPASSTQVRSYMTPHDIHVKYRLVWYWICTGTVAAAEVLSLVGMSWNVQSGVILFGVTRVRCLSVILLKDSAGGELRRRRLCL